jgi:hypothetical protein
MFEETGTLPFVGIAAMQYIPDGKYILFVLLSTKFVLWDIAAGTVVKELTPILERHQINSAYISKNCRAVTYYA